MGLMHAPRTQLESGWALWPPCPTPRALGRAQQVPDPQMYWPVACNTFSLKGPPMLSFFCSLAGGNSSDSDPDVGTTVLNLQPRARRFLPEQFSKKAPQAYKMEWKNEADADSRQAQPCSSPAAHSKEGGPQAPGVLCQPLLSKGHFGSMRGDHMNEGIRPKAPPRLVRRASEPGNRKGRFGIEKP